MQSVGDLYSTIDDVLRFGSLHCTASRLMPGPPRRSLRRIRDRFYRALLLTYLRELDIPADEAYGPGVFQQQIVDWPRRTIMLDEARRR